MENISKKMVFYFTKWCVVDDKWTLEQTIANVNKSGASRRVHMNRIKIRTNNVKQLKHSKEKNKKNRDKGKLANKQKTEKILSEFFFSIKYLCICIHYYDEAQ